VDDDAADGDYLPAAGLRGGTGTDGERQGAGAVYAGGRRQGPLGVDKDGAAEELIAGPKDERRGVIGYVGITAADDPAAAEGWASVLQCIEPCNNKRSTSSVGSMFTMSSRYVQVKYNLISM
ncbi:hypothetical protein NQ318_000266, partial [Aromia moschata]